jgi:hypothetical protein
MIIIFLIIQFKNSYHHTPTFQNAELRIKNWKERGRKWMWPNMCYYPGICLEGLEKITKILIQDSLSLHQDLNPGHPTYKAGVLPIQPQCSSATFDYNYFLIIHCGMKGDKHIYWIPPIIINSQNI